MNSDIVQSLVQSGDGEVCEIALRRLLVQSSLSEQHQLLLRERIPSLSHGQLLELLERHGDLGCTAAVVKRLVDEAPRDQARQEPYFLYVVGFLPAALGVDGYADFVEKVRPLVSAEVDWQLAARLRGCPLFDAIAKQVGGGPRWAYLTADAPIAANLLDVRYDERAILARIGAWIADADVAALFRLRWVATQVGRTELASAAWERCLERFPLLEPSHESDREREVRGYHWHLVLEWVNEASPARAERVVWLADRIASLEGFWPGPTFPEDLRNDVAHVFIDRGQPPEWGASNLRERLAGGSLDAWRMVFAWWRPEGKPPPPVVFFDRYSDCKAMVMEAPLPAEAPDDFDQAFLQCAEDLMAYEREQIESRVTLFGGGRPLAENLSLELVLDLHPTLGHHTAQFRPLITIPRLVDRLLQMPLTPTRAARVVRMSKGHPELIRDPRMLGVAASLSGPVAVHELPALDEIDVRAASQVTLYRRLGGDVADQRLREHVRQFLAEMKSGGEPHHLDRQIGWHWPWLRQIVDDDLRAELTSCVLTAPPHEVANLRHSVPWLVDDGMLMAAARRHLDAGLRWETFGMPEELRPFIEERARRTEDDKELAELLRWLEEHGAARSQRIAIVLACLESRPPTRELAGAVGRMLATQTAWEDDGPALLRAFARWRDWEVVAAIWSASPGWLGLLMASEKLLAKVHLVFATVILDLAAAAAEEADEDRLIATLTAVLALDPPPPIVRELARLRRRKDLSDRAIERIDAGMKLFKSMAGRVPSFEGLYEATAILRAADASRSGAS